MGHYYNNYTDLVDWWKITITFDGALVVNTTSDPTVDIDLHIYAANDDINWIASYDTSIGIHEATHRYDLAPGTYYIKAYPSPSTGYGSYTISNVYTPTGLANDIEPNDSAQFALTLGVNDSTTGHLGYFNQGYDDNNDWWKVTIPEDGNLIVRTYSDATLDIDLYMYGANDHVNWIAGYDISTGRNESTRYYGLKAGTYYVHGYPAPSTGYGSYWIYSDFVAAKFANDSEPNNDLGSALPIGLNSESNGHLGFFRDGSRDSCDYYTFTLPTAWDTLFVRTDSDPTIDIDLKLYNQSGTEIASSGSGGSFEMLIYPSAGAGTYSVRLYRYGGYGSYGVIVANVRPTEQMVDVKEQKLTAILPKSFGLSQNYPNPFNPSTNLRFQIPNSGHVTLKVYNMLGCEVATLVNEVRPAGVYNFQWNASNLPSGVYFYRLHAGNFVEVRKAILMK
jgi:hypothetical protein